MRDDTEIMRDIQRLVREQLDERGISLKVVSAKGKIPYSTLCSYFPGNERSSTPRTPAELSGSAMRRLFGAIPNDLMNLLMPEGWAVVRVPEGIDFDDISSACRDFIDAKEKAHHPESECGRDIGPNEHSELGSKIVQFRGRVA